MREMKDSGVEWIGEIPKDWGICKLKNVAKIQTGNTPTKTEQDIFYSDTEGIPWIKAEDLGSNKPIINTKEFLTEEGEKYGRIFPENTVYVCCIASIGKTGFSQVKCSCNQQINGISFINMYWKFGYYVTLAQEMEYILYASGNVMKIINTEKQLNLRCPLPTIDEQKRIADYLDSMCHKIDDIIEKQQTIIEKLKEYKLSVITEAVTKGLNSDVDMVTCDAEWISEMPVNWMTAPIKKVTEFITCGVAATPEYTDESNGFLFLSAQNVKDGKMDYTVKRYIVPELHESLTKKRKPRRGDIVQVRVGATIGNVAVVDTDEPYSVYVSLTHMRTNEMVTAEFFKYALSNSMFQQKAMSFVDFAGSQGNLNVADMKKLKILVPPIEEQKNISDYLTKNCNSIDEMINKKNKIVEKLQEYKKSLIYEVVTGKKEV